MKTLIALLILTLAFTSAADECDEDGGCTEVAAAQPGLPAEVIQAYETPDFEQLIVSRDLLDDRWYMRMNGTVPIYDAPGGNVIRTLDEGFNFVTALMQQEGWTQINSGEWVETRHVENTQYVLSEFTGIFLPNEPLEYTPAWLLVNLYPSDEPGGEPRESNGLLYRYAQVMVFDSVDVDGWRWYQIGVDLWVQQTNVAKVLPLEKPAEVETERWISIDLYEQVLIVYDGDRPIFATLVSTGLPRWPTYEGVFNIYYRTMREEMSWGTPGDDFYYLEEVPWTLYFDEGRALHGAYWHDGLGYRRSHGCVNMSITDAHWLYHWVAEEFETLRSPDVETGPAVYVYSSGEYK